MNTTLLNNHTKFGAKISRHYQLITFYVLGHFLATPCRYKLAIRKLSRVTVQINSLTVYIMP